jgi:hypothetical protein
MNRNLVLVTSLALCVSAMSGAPTKAATPEETADSIVGACGMFDSNCIDAACAAVLTSADWGTAEQGALGTRLAEILNVQASSDPAGADKLQSCAASGPAALQEALALGAVADIGSARAASAQ